LVCFLQAVLPGVSCKLAIVLLFSAGKAPSVLRPAVFLIP
jgi:hypothetical protein